MPRVSVCGRGEGGDHQPDPVDQGVAEAGPGVSRRRRAVHRVPHAGHEELSRP